MGLDYAYEMWVPQERLYSFLELVNEKSDTTRCTTFSWPDGRELEFAGSSNSNRGKRGKNVIPFDCSLNDYFRIPLLSKPDEILDNSHYRYSIDKNGNYIINTIDVRFRLTPDKSEWLDEEGYYTYVSFTSMTSATSRALQDSLTLRRLFLDIAREGAAISCVLDTEYSNDRTFFLDGKEMDKEGFAYAHFRDLRGFLNSHEKISEREHRLLICKHSGDLSHHDLLARIEWAQSDEDAGIRAAACKLLAKIQSDEVEIVLCEIASADKDWRVRYVAVCCLKERKSKFSENTLFKALYDEDYQVRIAAIQTLAERENRTRSLANELENLLTKLPFRGPSMGAFYTAMKSLCFYKVNSNPHHAQIIRQRMSEPSFPFEWEAQQAIERLERRI